MATPKVSVIVANYCHAQYIEQALESLANQTYQDIEVLICDDGSTDNSKDIIENWCLVNNKQNEYKRIYLPENRGKWFALNTAISQASGKLITLNDADDRSCSERIERQVKCLENNNSFHNLCGFVHCYTQEDIDKHKNYKVPSPAFFDVMPHKEVVKWVLEGRRTPNINHYYTGEFEVHGASCLFYKQHWTNGMRFLEGGNGTRCALAEDGDFNTKMTLLLQKTSVLKEPLYVYRRNTATNGAYLCKEPF